MVSGVGVRLSVLLLVYAGWLQVITGIGVLVFSFFRKGKKTVSFGLCNWKQGWFNWNIIHK